MIDRNETEFTTLRYSLGEIIKSEEVFSKQADHVATVIQTLLVQYNQAIFKPFKLKSAEINLLEEAKKAFEILAKGENIWQEIGGALNIENKNGNSFVCEPISKISTFLDKINQGLTTKDPQAPFNLRFKACMYLSSVYNDLSQLFEKELKKPVENLPISKMLRLPLASFLITPAQRVARWPLLMNTLNGQLNDVLEKIQVKPIDYFNAEDQKKLTETVKSSLRKFTRVAVIVNRCTGAIQNIIQALNIKKISDSKRNLIIDNLGQEIQNAMLQSVIIGQAENNSQIEVSLANDNPNDVDLDDSQIDELIESHEFKEVLEGIAKTDAYTTIETPDLEEDFSPAQLSKKITSLNFSLTSLNFDLPDNSLDSEPSNFYDADNILDLTMEPSTTIRSLPLLLRDNKFEKVKEKLIASTPFKDLVAHMEGSKKWLQINAYLVAIKSANTLEELKIAVDDDPKDVHFHVAARGYPKMEKFDITWDENVLYSHEKSMRENTGWHLFGIFHQSRSQTEQYALELKEVLNKLCIEEEKHKNNKRGLLSKSIRKERLSQ